MLTGQSLGRGGGGYGRVDVRRRIKNILAQSTRDMLLPGQGGCRRHRGGPVRHMQKVQQKGLNAGEMGKGEKGLLKSLQNQA